MNASIQNTVNLAYLGYPAYSLSSDGILYSHYVVRNPTGKKISREIDLANFTLVTQMRQLTVGHRPQIRLVSEAGQRDLWTIADLVATVFVENKNNYKLVHHLDEDILNLNAENLIWINNTTSKAKDLKGHKYTTKDDITVTVLGIVDDSHVDVVASSDKALCGNNQVILTTTKEAVKLKKVKHPYFPNYLGVACLGIGEYTPSKTVDGKEIKSDFFIRWSGMIQRCYDNIPDAVSYKDCSVEEYLRVFQNYAKTVDDKMTECGITSLTGYEIDKDIKLAGNKIYSRDTILIVPAFVNTFFSKNSILSGKFIPSVCLNIARKEFSIQNGGKVIKFYSFDKDLEINVTNVKNLLDLFIKTKSISAKSLLLRMSLEYPEYKIPMEVTNAILNFDKFLMEQVYASANIHISKTIDNNYILSNESEELLRSKITQLFAGTLIE